MTTPGFTHDKIGTSAAEWADWATRTGSWTRTTDPALDLTAFDRVVVVAAHPDDETLGAGGLIATAVSQGLEVRLLVATSGEGSHPESPTVTPDELAAIRSRELVAAATVLGVDPSRLGELGLPDGGVEKETTELITSIVDLVGDGRSTLLVAPWRFDGHPDHEAAGRAAAAAARRTGATLAEFPVWFWHWAEAGDPRATDLVPLPLSSDARTRKHRAIRAHRSQVEPLSEDPRDATLLDPRLLAHFEQGTERFWTTSAPDCPDQSLDRLHQEQPDPWGVDTRWFERRKRDLVLAALPRPEYDAVLDLGCSTGALTAALADRLRADDGRLTAVDASATAVDHARERLAGRPAVTVRQVDFPHAWPDGDFDLVVISEVGYFLAPVDVELLARRVAASLRPGGAVVLCHWTHPIDGWVLDAAGVHDHFAAPGLPPVAASYDDQDIAVRVLCAEWPEADR